MFQVVVKKFMEVGIKKVRFTGSKRECVRWMSEHRHGYYDLIGPDGRQRSFVLEDTKPVHWRDALIPCGDLFADR